MRDWIELADEVVVVDSFSQDGTVQLIQSGLRHPNLRFLTHPPGLYQSWNHGIGQLHTRYVYISTVGDSITRQGLEHLHAVAERLECDVVVSKPRFIANDGSSITDDARWPIDDIIHTLQARQPVRLVGMRLFLFALTNVTGAILGSSASNLYRARVLQERPFPADYGTVGDGAWGIANVFDYHLGVTPERCSTFRCHPKAYAASDYAVEDLNWKLFELAQTTFEQRRAADPALLAEALRCGCDQLIRLVRSHLQWHRRLERFRRGRFPWSLNPAAWHARARRNHFGRRMHEYKLAVLRSLDHGCLPGPHPSTPLAGG